MQQSALIKTSQYKQKYSSNIDLVFLFYWGVLVFWQNIINRGSTGSTADTLIKLVLLGIMAGYYILRGGSFKVKNLVLVFFVLGSISIPFLQEESYNMRILTGYFFPMFFVFLTFVVGEKYKISKKQLLRFLNGIIVIVLSMAMFAIIFMPQKFLNALSLTNSYGNELSSFLLSNHEYALYLFAAIVSCIMCLELDKNQSGIKKGYYTVCIMIFILNLILTFSRTFMLGMGCVFLIYCFMQKKGKLREILLIGGSIAVLLVLFVPTINNFFFSIILKDNNSAGRDVLAKGAIEFFESSSLIEQFFGAGLSKSKNCLELEAGHHATHNAYLQVLLYFGFLGCIAMVGLIICRIVQCFKVIKVNRFIGVMSLALSVSCFAVMFFNTTTLFFSSTDSFFLTMFTIVVPKYVINAIKTGTFNE